MRTALAYVTAVIFMSFVLCIGIAYLESLIPVLVTFFGIVLVLYGLWSLIVWTRRFAKWLQHR